MLKARAISRVVITGLALDYCVYYTSKDAVSLGELDAPISVLHLWTLKSLFETAVLINML